MGPITFFLITTLLPLVLAFRAKSNIKAIRWLLVSIAISMIIMTLTMMTGFDIWLRLVQDFTQPVATTAPGIV